MQYKIADDTDIKHIPIARFLSHEKIKSRSNRLPRQSNPGLQKESIQLFITAASGHTRSNGNLHFEDNNHEEADTLMICLAAKASQRCPDAQMVFFSPDTDVLVLAVTHYEKLCKKTSISMVSGMVDVEPTWRALGKEKAQVLSAFHAFTGADEIVKFQG